MSSIKKNVPSAWYPTMDSFIAKGKNAEIWDKNNKLVLGNAEAKKRFEKFSGLKLNKSLTRSEMTKNAIKKGHILPPEGISKKEYISIRNKEYELSLIHI